MAAAAGLPLAPTQRVIDGVHGHASHAGPLAQPATATGLPPGYELVLGVPDLAHGRPALRVDEADLAGRHAKGGLPAFLGQELDARSCGSGHLRPRPGLQLDGVDEAQAGGREPLLRSRLSHEGAHGIVGGWGISLLLAAW